MPTRNVDLTEHYDQFVDTLVTSGRFKDIGEVLRAGLRLLEEQTQAQAEKLAALRSLASEAFRELDQGLGTVIEDDKQLTELIGRIGRRAASRVEQGALGE